MNPKPPFRQASVALAPAGDGEALSGRRRPAVSGAGYGDDARSDQHTGQPWLGLAAMCAGHTRNVLAGSADRNRRGQEQQALQDLKLD
jgi:hypothetical protein